MRHEIFAKLRALLNQRALSESEVSHLMTLGRKLIEEIPAAERSQYALLGFYCDWSLHRQIDRSPEGAEILGRVHTLVVSHLRKTDNSGFAADVTTALSFSETRNQFNALLQRFNDGRAPIIIRQDQWEAITLVLVEIISSCPISFPRNNRSLPTRIREILAAARVQPIKGDSVVEQLIIAKVPTSVFTPGTPDGQITYCVVIVTSDTTRLVTPLVKSTSDSNN